MRPKVTLDHRPELDGDAEPVPMLTADELNLLELEVNDEFTLAAEVNNWRRLLYEHAALKVGALVAKAVIESARAEVSERVIDALSTDEECQATKAGKYHVALYVLKRVRAILRAYAEQPVAIQEVD